MTAKVAKGTSKSAVSRRVVAATEKALTELMTADLSGLELSVLMIDGVHFGEHCCVVALGIGSDGTKNPLALVERSTENAALARELLADLRERGLDVTRPILVVLDGAKALHRAVTDVFDHPVIQRCQLHKKSEMSVTGCPRSCVRWSNGGCAMPTKAVSPNVRERPRGGDQPADRRRLYDHPVRSEAGQPPNDHIRRPELD